MNRRMARWGILMFVAGAPALGSASSLGCSSPPPQGSGGAGGAPRTCETVRAEFQAELKRVQACSADSECGQPVIGSSCGCTMDLVAAKAADLFQLQALMRETVAGQRCVYTGSSCGCPAADGFACKLGACTWNYR